MGQRIMKRIVWKLTWTDSGTLHGGNYGSCGPVQCAWMGCGVPVLKGEGQCRSGCQSCLQFRHTFQMPPPVGLFHWPFFRSPQVELSFPDKHPARPCCRIGPWWCGKRSKRSCCSSGYQLGPVWRQIWLRHRWYPPNKIQGLVRIIQEVKEIRLGYLNNCSCIGISLHRVGSSIGGLNDNFDTFPDKFPNVLWGQGCPTFPNGLILPSIQNILPKVFL